MCNLLFFKALFFSGLWALLNVRYFYFQNCLWCLCFDPFINDWCFYSANLRFRELFFPCPTVLFASMVWNGSNFTDEHEVNRSATKLNRTRNKFRPFCFLNCHCLCELESTNKHRMYTPKALVVNKIQNDLNSFRFHFLSMLLWIFSDLKVHRIRQVEWQGHGSNTCVSYNSVASMSIAWEKNKTGVCVTDIPELGLIWLGNVQGSNNKPNQRGRDRQKKRPTRNPTEKKCRQDNVSARHINPYRYPQREN